MKTYALPPMFLAALALGSCAENEKERVPQLRTTGPHGFVIGETGTITAETLDATDPGYVFLSAEPAVAAVDEAGLVTALAVGETDIIVTGTKSKASVRHAIVVTSDGSDELAVPYYDAWLLSSHADSTAEAFRHWDEDGEIPASCARCHSRAGYIDYLGGDGSAAGTVESPATPGTVVDCATCHDPAAVALDSVTFPSGIAIEGLGAEARCMVCHQGRSSGATVDADILAAGVSSPDEVSDALGFENIHYYPAAATLYAGAVGGGYEYEEEHYDTRFRHAPGFDSCVTCHDPHSTKVRFEACQSCHPEATDLTGAHSIRMIASRNQDYDGDGDTSEGIYYEVEGLRTQLLASIQRYGLERATPLCYDSAAYPYWFKDGDGDGSCSAEEAAFPNRFVSWSARLVRATYNFQLATKEPGAFAHNAKYIIQLLHDSIQDVNLGLTTPFELASLARQDIGHFDGSGEAARHWDEDAEVQASCSRCHSGAPGFRFFVEYGVGQSVPETSNGLECATCHTSFGDEYAVLEVGETAFPHTTATLPGDDNLCATCHSGRASGPQLKAAIDAGDLRFQNVHYLAAASTLNGGDVGQGFEYDGNSYAGRLVHTGGTQCTSCHDPVFSNHTFAISDVFDARCDLCHADQDQADEIRSVHLLDYDGDGNSSESLRDELAGMAAKLLLAMKGAAPALCYSPDAYPYFFTDNDGTTDAYCQPGEASFGNRFLGWNGELLGASFNFQLHQTEPGAWAHNFAYMGQLLYDSTVELAGDGQGMTRP